MIPLISTNIGFLYLNEIEDKKGIIVDGGAVTGWHKGQEEAIEIRTKRGYSLVVGLSQSIKVNKEWEKVRDIMVGDCVDLVVGSDLWTKKCFDTYFFDFSKMGRFKLNLLYLLYPFKDIIGEEIIEQVITYGQKKETFENRYFPPLLDEDFARFISIVVNKKVSERKGNKTWHSCVIIIDLVGELIEECRRLVKKLFNKDLLYLYNDYYGMAYKLATEVFPKFLGVKDNDKNIPFSILQSPKKVMADFLMICFDYNGKLRDLIVFDAESKEFSTIVQKVLLKFGILSTLERVFPYRLYIQKKSMARFKEEIGFFSTNKKEMLDKLLKYEPLDEEDHFDEIIRINKLGKQEIYKLKTEWYSANGFFLKGD